MKMGKWFLVYMALNLVACGKANKSDSGSAYGMSVPVQSTGSNTAAPSTASDVSTSITRYYQLYLGRAPESAGLNYWLNLVVNQGITLAQVEYEIRVSPESQIRQMYLRYLHREPDQAGLRYWQGLVSSGISLGQIEQAIRTSPEAMSR